MRLYTPMIFTWGCRSGLSTEDASDLVQDVFALLVEELPNFVYDRNKSFRGWLHTVTLNVWRQKLRRHTVPLVAASESNLADLSEGDGVEMFTEEEYRQHLVEQALRIMQTDFEPTTWQACWEYVVAGRPAAEVAGELGVTVDVVYSAKSRVLRRLRQELDGLWD